MTATEVSKIIADEIASVGEKWFGRPENNPHGLDLGRCLVEPRRVVCRNTFPQFRDGKPFPAWVVLEEQSDCDDCYRIIFDEELRKFGLAGGIRLMPSFLGWHGTFLNTVRGM
jgi:hypothetical protein